MLKERTESIRTFLYLTEIFLLSVTYFLVYYFFSHAQTQHLFPHAEIIPAVSSLDDYLRAYWFVLFVWAALLKVRGEYENLRVQTYFRVVTNHLLNGFIFFAFFTSFAFLLKFQFLSRVFIVTYTVLSVTLLLLNRLVVLSVAHTVRSRGYNYRNLLIVGTGRRAQEFLSTASKHKEWGYRVVGFLDRDAKMVGKKISEYLVMGSLEELPRILETTVVDEVVFIVPRNWLQMIEKCILYCEAIGVPATLSTDFFDLEIASGVPKEMDGFTYLTFETSRLKETELVIKRTLDILFSFAVLILTSPVLIGVAIAIRMTSDGPVFFKQIRCGRNGRKFYLYKFRSMVADAEKRLEELKALNEMSGPVFKITNDPRLTKIGRFLRKTSLDEFPQFWNVLRGDMSLVGPRPPLPKEVEQYEPWHRRRLSMKPGITCIWQVSGRNQIDFENWMKLDLEYIDHWSLWLDFKIIALTVKAVSAGTGAK